MYLPRYFCVCIVFLLLCVAAEAQSAAFFFDDRSAFLKATDGARSIDFESVAPRKGFGKYAPDVGLNVNGISFRTFGGARFGAGTIYVPSADYTALNPGMKMIDGAHLAWGAPNQPGNAYLELRLPDGVKAIGADLWTMQPIVSPIEMTVTTRDGSTHTSTISTRKRPESAFAGFVSRSEIASVRFTIAKGQSTLLLDNLAFGRDAEGVDLAALAAKPSTSPSPIDSGKATPSAASAQNEKSSVRRETSNARSETASTRSETSDTQTATVAPSKDVPGASQASVSQGSVQSSSANKAVGGTTSNSSASGSIAYVRDDTQIRLISPDGSNDRLLWTHEGALKGVGINELAWRPDGGELAFSSGHESVTSFYHADIFAMKPNATGIRRITNGPDRSDFSKYGKGTVTVTVRNEQPIFRTSKASTGVFFVYVMGAEMPQPLTLPPGSSRTLTFTNVADFGDHAQAIVAVYGATRWFIPGTDVKAGKIVKAPDFGISGDGLELFGAFRPAWKSDGSRINYRNGVCIVSGVSSKGTVGHSFDPVFKGENPPAPCAYDWGPTPETADHLLYALMTDEEIVIYRLKGNSGQHPGEKITTISKEKYQWISDVRWLPDGSGFLVSVADLAYSFANILRFDLATRQFTPVTNFEEMFVKSFTVSPDGKWIVFERTQKFVDNDADLWIVGIDGKGLRLLAKNANHPAWGK